MRLQLSGLAALILFTAPAQAAPVVPPSLAAGFVNSANATSPLGTNLTEPVDFATEYPFVNLRKQARAWFSGPVFGFQDSRALDLDARGEVRSLQADQAARMVLFDASPADPTLPGRVLDVFFAGDGDLRYDNNVEVVFRKAGHDRIRLLAPLPGDKQTLIIVLTRTNAANPLRNIRILPTGGICAGNPLRRVAAAGGCPGGDFLSFRANHATIVFNPDFLAHVKAYRGLRFMDWMQANETFADIDEGVQPQRVFADRPQVNDAFWSTSKGVPLEIIIALCNLMHAEPWFNLGHKVDNDYVRQFATIVRDQLDPSLKATVEYSNETWNGIFGQADFVRRRGEAAGLVESGESDNFLAGQRFYARRARQVMQIFEDVFGGTARLNRVMATQAVQPFITETILSFEDAAAHVDQFAIAPYFGGVIDTPEEQAEIKRIGVDGVFSWLLTDDNEVFENGDFNGDGQLDGATSGSLAKTRVFMQAQANTAAQFGVALTSYEGGQHLLTGGGAFGDPEVDAILEAVNGDPRMKTVYRTYLGDVQDITGTRFYHFRNCDQWNVFGYWGALRFQLQPRADAPKYDAILSFIATHPVP
jgi:hypothetical protein